MTSRDFAYWLQGYFEIHGRDELSPCQVEIVKRHLALVFRHEIDPQEPGHLAELRDIHEGRPSPPRPAPPLPRPAQPLPQPAPPVEPVSPPMPPLPPPLC